MKPFMEDSSRELTKVGVEYKDGKWIMLTGDEALLRRLPILLRVLLLSKHLPYR